MIRQIGGGDLVGIEIESGENRHALEVPRRAKRDQIACTAVFERFHHLIVGERRPGQHIESVLRAEVLAYIIRIARIAIERRHVPHLKLGAVGAGGGRMVDQFLGVIQAAVMIYADLRDDEGGFVRSYQPSADAESDRAAARESPDFAEPVNERDEGYTLGE